MAESIVLFLQDVTNNNYLTLFLISIIPIVELRGAILLISSMPDVNYLAGMFVCIAGSSSVIIPLVFLLKPIIKAMKKTKLFGKIASFAEGMLSDKAQKVTANADESKRKLSADSKKFLGVMTFTCVPLPLTGVWMASGIGAFLDFNNWKTVLAIFLGNLITAAVYTIIVLLVPVQYIDIVVYIFIALVVILLIGSFIPIIVKVVKQHKLKKANEELKENDESATSGSIEAEDIAGQPMEDAEASCEKK